jgi:hypothetical protein
MVHTGREGCYAEHAAEGSTYYSWSFNCGWSIFKPGNQDVQLDLFGIVFYFILIRFFASGNVLNTHQ